MTKVRRAQYKKAIYCMESGCNKLSQIPEILPFYIFDVYLPITVSVYLLLPFFNKFVIGFTIAEGSLLIKKNFDGCFQIKQRLHIELFEAFKLLFNTTRKITIENKLYAQFVVLSKKDIQTVIYFFSSCEELTLLGNKHFQYKNWLMHLKSSKRYSKLNFPI